MYAVIKTGGKQYRVKAGDMLVVEKVDGDAGSKVAFDQVLMLGDGAGVTVGAPLVSGAVVNATLVETRKGVKIKVFKKIRRQGYRRTQGHRQFETVLRVTGISGEGKSETWDGEIDLTTRAVINARARGLKLEEPKAAKVKADPAPKAEAKTTPKAAPKTAKPAPAPKATEAKAPAAKAETPAKKAAAPKAKAAPKAEAAKAPAKAAAPKKPAAKKAAKADGDDA